MPPICAELDNDEIQGHHLAVDLIFDASEYKLATGVGREPMKRKL